MHTAHPLAMLALAALLGCDSAPSMLQTAAPSPAPAPKPPTLVYTANAAPVPFLPLPARVAEAAPDDALVKARLVAIFSANQTPKAMFTDHKGHGHIFEVGDNFWGGGRIAQIAPNKVEIDVTPQHLDAPPGRIVMRLFDDAPALTTNAR